MYDIGDLIEKLEEITTIKFIQPTKGQRYAMPYVSIVPILSNQGDVYQKVTHQGVIGPSTFIEETRWPRYTAFSVTAISEPDDQVSDVDTSSLAPYIAQTVFNKFKTQVMFDFFRSRQESFRIVVQPQARFLVEDDWNEERWGFDIMIGDTVTITEDKEYIDTLTLSGSVANKIDKPNTTDDIGDIIIVDP